MVSKQLIAIAGVAVLGAVTFFGCGPDSVDAAGSGTKAGKSGQPDGPVTIRIFNENGELEEPVTTHPVALSDADWKKKLTPKQYYILREKGTERAFSGKLLDNKKAGVYTCAGCNLPLFASDTKFKSGTGWPSFYAPLAEENVLELEDRSHGMVRTEILCARCNGHLGHVFNDGPQPTGLRYCLNSESLGFTAQENVKELAEEVTVVTAADSSSGGAGEWLPLPEKNVPLTEASGEAKAVFGGGCFWCTEAAFETLDGVSAVVSGYAGGDAKQANYKAVCTGTTDHAEVIEITYDPSTITYGELLRVFFTVHDPTTLNYQKPDTGPQYRSAIFYQSDAEKALAEAYIKQLDTTGKFDDPIVTSLEPLEKFFPAEEYHQDFMKKNPNHGYIQTWAVPKLKKLKKMLSSSKTDA